MIQATQDMCKRCGECCTKVIEDMWKQSKAWRKKKKGCEMLVFDKDGKARCLIYNDRPELCKKWVCTGNQG